MSKILSLKFFCLNLSSYVKQMKEGAWKGTPTLGRPIELGTEGEAELMRRINAFCQQFTHITADVIVREALDIAGTRREGEVDDRKAINRLMHVGGEQW